MARDAVVICGAHSISWQAFCGVCHQISCIVFDSWTRSCYAGSGFQRAYYIISSFELEGHSAAFARQKGSLFLLLSWFNCFEASKIHDKVYALVGLTSDVQDPQPGVSVFEPRCDLKASQEYTKAARFIIENSGDLSVFDACMGSQTLPGLPSWVPD